MEKTPFPVLTDPWKLTSLEATRTVDNFRISIDDFLHKLDCNTLDCVINNPDRKLFEAKVRLLKKFSDGMLNIDKYGLEEEHIQDPTFKPGVKPAAKPVPNPLSMAIFTYEDYKPSKLFSTEAVWWNHTRPRTIYEESRDVEYTSEIINTETGSITKQTKKYLDNLNDILNKVVEDPKPTKEAEGEDDDMTQEVDQQEV